MSGIKQKTFLGRKVKSERVITRGPNVEFGALYEAANELEKNGNYIGELDGSNPIGFSLNSYFHCIKWHSLSKEDKDKLDGVLVSENFSTSNVKIIFFED